MNLANLAIKSLVIVRGWFFWAGSAPTVTPSSVLLLDFWPAVFVTMVALFVFEQVVLTFYHRVYYISLSPLSSLSLSPPFSPFASVDEDIDVVNFFLTVFCNVFSVFSISRLIFSLFFHPFLPLFALFLCLSVYFLQCDQVQVIPIPSVCIISFIFFSITTYPTFACYATGAASSQPHACIDVKTKVPFRPGEILHGPILMVLRLSQRRVVPLSLHSHSWLSSTMKGGFSFCSAFLAVLLFSNKRFKPSHGVWPYPS